MHGYSRKEVVVSRERTRGNFFRDKLELILVAVSQHCREMKTHLAFRSTLPCLDICADGKMCVA